MTPRRFFNGSERVALFLAADGRCSRCGEALRPGWHADHVNAYSRGGVTDVTNGQALCPACNMTKGNKHMVELRAWQTQALARLMETEDDFLAVATPAAGKTDFALIAALELMLQGIRRIIVVAPTVHLKKQWAKAAKRLGLDLDHRFLNGNAVLAPDFQGAIVTHAAVSSGPLLFRKMVSDPATPTLVIIDEVHHGGDDQAWGDALKLAFEPAARRILLSGTPFRTDGTAIPFVKYDDQRKCIPGIDYGYGKALEDGIVRPIEFFARTGPVRWRSAGATSSTDLADADGDTLSAALAAALSPTGDWITSVLCRADEELTRHRVEIPDAGGLVVAADQHHARQYADILERISGERPTVAISDDKGASESIERFYRGSSRWIIAVQMVAEGVDIPRLSVGVYASKVRTEQFFRQVVGRFVRVRSASDDTSSTLFLPAVQPLLKIAQDIEISVDEALAESVLATKVGEGEGAVRVNLVEPLDSGESVHHSTILAGDSILDDELRRADGVMREAGIRTGITTAQMARALRVAGFGRVVGTATVMPPASPTEKPLADVKVSLRRSVNRKVGALNRKTEQDHKFIHADMNREFRDTAGTATVETLHARLAYLDDLLSRP